MRRCLITCLALLAACGPDVATVPPELLVPPTGYVGPRPATEGQLKTAIIADKRALGQCVMQLESISAILPSG